MIELVQQDKVSFSAAATKLFPVLLTNKTDDPMQLAADLNLLQTSNVNELELWVDEVLLSMPEKVEEYKKGKKGLIGLFMGEVKKRSKGKADPKRTNDILLSKLN
jgi:aspartyl-tRNA(Asn)/glutamyl-tRNA(Gln) amidotransferase subunit B